MSRNNLWVRVLSSTPMLEQEARERCAQLCCVELDLNFALVHLFCCVCCWCCLFAASRSVSRRPLLKSIRQHGKPIRVLHLAAFFVSFCQHLTVISAQAHSMIHTCRWLWRPFVWWWQGKEQREPA